MRGLRARARVVCGRTNRKPRARARGCACARLEASKRARARLCKRARARARARVCKRAHARGVNVLVREKSLNSVSCSLKYSRATEIRNCSSFMAKQGSSRDLFLNAHSSAAQQLSSSILLHSRTGQTPILQTFRTNPHSSIRAKFNRIF